jgi:hypothetical protein
MAGKVTLGSRGIAPDQGLDAKISLPEDRVAVQLRVQKVVGTADDGQLVSMQIYRYAVNSSIPSPVRLICCSLHRGEEVGRLKTHFFTFPPHAYLLFSHIPERVTQIFAPLWRAYSCAELLRINLVFLRVFQSE